MKERRTSVNASRLTVSGRPRSQGATRALEHRGPGRGGEGRSLHRLPGPLEPVQIRVRRLGVPVRIAVSVFGDIEPGSGPWLPAARLLR
jgi:hypothetical protein